MRVNGACQRMAYVSYMRITYEQNLKSSNSLQRTQVQELTDVEQVYDDLMNLIVRLGNAGVIHGDFNEFNLMLTDDGTPILIDFPQMMSTSHENAEL